MVLCGEHLNDETAKAHLWRLVIRDTSYGLITVASKSHSASMGRKRINDMR